MNKHIHIIFPFLLILFISRAYSQEGYQVSATDFQQLKSAKSLDSMTFTSVRALDEINVNNQANNYPWISNDGLRLYYTQSGTNYRVYSASRKDIYSGFSDIKVLNINQSAKDIYSICLSSDELEAYFVMFDSSVNRYPKLYYAKRSSISNDFSAPVNVYIADPNKTIQGIQSPSLSKDKSKIYIFNSHSKNSIQSIYILSRIDSVHFSVSDSIPSPVFTSGIAYSARPGQLSRDDDKYVLGVVDLSEGGQQIYFYSRANSKVKFTGSLHKLTIQDPITYYDYFQPTLSAGNDVLVFVSNTSGIAQGNRLYIAINQTTGIKEINKQIFLTAPSPNPVSDNFSIAYQLPLGIKDAVLEFYNYNGVKLKEISIDKHSGNLQFSHNVFAPGFYLYSIHTNIGNSTVSKLIIL